MITASIYGIPVSPIGAGARDESESARIACEIAERIIELNELRAESGTEFICRLGRLAALNASAFRITVEVLHGNLNSITDPYSTQADNAWGRTKQGMHYRMREDIKPVKLIFPQVYEYLTALIESKLHHEDPIERGRVIEEAKCQPE